jgi:hypothetical protein
MDGWGVLVCCFACLVIGSLLGFLVAAIVLREDK